MKSLVALAVALSTTALVTSVSAAGLNMPPPGPVKPQAAPGDLGMAIMSAVVNADGTFARGEGVTSVSSPSTGIYSVGFGRSIEACTWIGSTGQAGFVGSGFSSTIFITGLNGTTNALFVQTFDSAGAAANKPFHVVIYCGR